MSAVWVVNAQLFISKKDCGCELAAYYKSPVVCAGCSFPLQETAAVNKSSVLHFILKVKKR